MSATGPDFTIGEAPELHCPACASRGIRTFYRIDGIPVHDCRLMPTREAALGLACGDLHLGYCVACGFVFNTLFDPSDLDYATAYEETQGFSPTFSAFAEESAKEAVDRYDLHGRTILEIGCGKGEYLASLCALGGNKGVGVDPAYVPGRLPEELTRDLVFHQEFFHAEHMECKPDFLCCRHTLEHIPEVLPFVTQVREAIAHSPGPRDLAVCFDLPDTRRIWREGAFWDIFHEHCSYFSVGTVARLFRRCGFTITDLTREYDDQYISLCAVPADGPTEATLELEADAEQNHADILGFTETCRSKVDFFRVELQALFAQGERIVIWGGGSKGVSFLTTLGLAEEVIAAVDINPFKQGQFMPGSGHPVVGPQDLKEIRPTQVVLMNPIYEDEIRADLNALGLNPRLIPCR